MIEKDITLVLERIQQAQTVLMIGETLGYSGKTILNLQDVLYDMFCTPEIGEALLRVNNHFSVKPLTGGATSVN